MYDFKQILADSQYDFSQIGLPRQADDQIKNELFAIIAKGLERLNRVANSSSLEINQSRLFDTIIHVQYALIWRAFLPIAPDAFEQDFFQKYKEKRVDFNRNALTDTIDAYINFLTEFYTTYCSPSGNALLKTTIPQRIFPFLKRFIEFMPSITLSDRVGSSLSLIHKAIELCENKQSLEWNNPKYFIYVYNLMLFGSVWVTGQNNLCNIGRNFFGFGCVEILNLFESDGLDELYTFLLDLLKSHSLLKEINYPSDKFLGTYSLPSLNRGSSISLLPPVPSPSRKPIGLLLLPKSVSSYTVLSPPTLQRPPPPPASAKPIFASPEQPPNMPPPFCSPAEFVKQLEAGAVERDLSRLPATHKRVPPPVAPRPHKE